MTVFSSCIQICENNVMRNQNTSTVGAVYIGTWDAFGKAPMKNQMCLKTVTDHVIHHLPPQTGTNTERSHGGELSSYWLTVCC